MKLAKSFFVYDAMVLSCFLEIFWSYLLQFLPIFLEHLYITLQPESQIMQGFDSESCEQMSKVFVIETH